jgi:hypothetical protein
MTADSSTPSTRKGSACTITATNTVIQLCITGADSAPRIGPWSTIPTSSSMIRTRGELNCQPRGSLGSASSTLGGAVSVVVTGEVPPVRR